MFLLQWIKLAGSSESSVPHPPHTYPASSAQAASPTLGPCSTGGCSHVQHPRPAQKASPDSAAVVHIGQQEAPQACCKGGSLVRHCEQALQYPRGWISSKIPWHKPSSEVWISVLGCVVDGRRFFIGCSI